MDILNIVTCILLFLAATVDCKTVISPRKYNGVFAGSSVSNGAIPGRVVSVSARTYRDSFRVFLELGQCPYVYKNGELVKCSVKFEGDVEFVPKGSMDVSVSRVQNADDVITYGMGGGGLSVGVLGIVSVTPKVKVAVSTTTSRKTLNLMSSYDMTKGFLTLRNPKPTTSVPGEGSLFLSEIELGGNELLMVTLEFENEQKKTEVEVTVTFKILFWSITAKLNYIKNVLKVKSKARVQFKSTWREDIDRSFPTLDQAIPEVEKLEAMYSNGPKELREMNNDNEYIYSVYHFSSWKQSPYGTKFNMALINHDIEFLTDQKTEIDSILSKIASLFKKLLGMDQRRQLTQLNETLTEKSSLLTTGLLQYHTLDATGRQNLRDIYGRDRAPSYYSRELYAIVKE